MMVSAETIGIWSLGIGMLSIEWIGIIIPEQQQLYGVDTRCECTIIDPNVYTTILRICHLMHRQDNYFTYLLRLSSSDCS